MLEVDRVQGSLAAVAVAGDLHELPHHPRPHLGKSPMAYIPSTKPPFRWRPSGFQHPAEIAFLLMLSADPSGGEIAGTANVKLLIRKGNRADFRKGQHPHPRGGSSGSA